MLEKAFVFHET